MLPNLTRRNMLKLAALTAAPLILPSRLFGAEAPSNQVTVGFIGIGWQGAVNLDSFLGVDGCRVVACADVDQGHLDNAVNKINDHYKNQDGKGYRDFRELLARKDIDAVAICTPDHWHAIIAIAAAKAGKDIFCEKPLSHVLSEGIAMVAAVQKAKRIWQTGSWQRSQSDFRIAAELVNNGYIGKVKRVEVGLPSGHSDYEGTGNSRPNENPPAGVDYDFWSGPATLMPFNPCRFHKNWRWNSNTGGGQLMDWIGHHCDIAHWGLISPFGCGIGDDHIGPLSLSATGEFPDPHAVWNTMTKFRIETQYPNKVELVIAGGHGDIQGGAKWIGETGWVSVDRGRFEVSNDDMRRDHNVKRKAGKLAMELYASPGHVQEFINSVKSRKRTLTPIEVAHRSQTPGHLGLIAARLGRRLTWDAKAQQFTNDTQANQLLNKPYRAPWKLDAAAPRKL